MYQVTANAISVRELRDLQFKLNSDLFNGVTFATCEEAHKFADITEGYTRLATDEDFNHYRGEYEIQEYDESLDRTMYRGNRLVLIKNYYAIGGDVWNQ